jgi:serpin B
MQRPLSIFFCLVLFCGCDQDSVDMAEIETQVAQMQEHIQAREVKRAFINDNTAFALDLYQQLRTQEGNLFLSPHSISTCLAMVYAGARGETERQMAAALRFALPQEQLHPAFGQLQSDLEIASDNIQLSVANSLWPAKGLALRKEFLAQMDVHYASEVTALNYGQPETARSTINSWVGEHTQGRIKELIQRGLITPETVVVLANAIYFKGTWLNPFDPENTRPMTFHLDGSTQINTPTMVQRRMECRFHWDSEVHLLELPYTGDSLSMVVLLPRDVDGLAELERGLTVNKLNTWLEGLHQTKADVWLPKFKVTSQFRLDEALKALGMVNAFGNADFSGMFERSGPSISAVVHEAFVEIDEVGTEAAAATGVIMTVSLPPSFRADHPFLFLIRHRPTGSMLFMGRITDPSQSD